MAVNGVRLTVNEAGSPEGPLLVFLHGFPETGFLAWRRQIIAFANAGDVHSAARCFARPFRTDRSVSLLSGWHVLAPDLRGFGHSVDVPTASINVEVRAL